MGRSQTQPVSSRQQAFSGFHERIGLKAFVPDFFDSIVAVMRDPRACLPERVLAWAKWRAWGNSSEAAVSHWDLAKAYPLDQIDCALDLAWLEEGKPADLVALAPQTLREQARSGPDRPRTMKWKSKISEAFGQLVNRRLVVFDGRRIIPVVSPVEPQKFTGRGTFEGNADFDAWWKVHDPRNFEAFQKARTDYLEQKKKARIAYRKYLESRTLAAANIINIKDVSKSVPDHGLGECETDRLANGGVDEKRRLFKSDESDRENHEGDEPLAVDEGLESDGARAAEDRADDSGNDGIDPERLEVGEPGRRSAESSRRHNRSRGADATVGGFRDDIDDIPEGARSTSASRVEEIREILLAELSFRLLGQYPSDALCRDVIRELGDAPLALFRMGIHGARARFTSYGLAIDIARDVARAYSSRNSRSDRWAPAASVPRWTDEELDRAADEQDRRTRGSTEPPGER